MGKAFVVDPPEVYAYGANEALPLHDTIRYNGLSVIAELVGGPFINYITLKGGGRGSVQCDTL